MYQQDQQDRMKKKKAIKGSCKRLIGFTILGIIILSFCLYLFLIYLPKFFSSQNHENLVRVNSKPLLALSIIPQEYFALKIGGDRIETMVLAGPGQNPHNFEPAPRQIQDLARADAWVLSGTEFEIGLESKIRALFPHLRVVDGTQGISFRSLESGEHSGADEADHAHGEFDRHYWLGQQGAELICLHIRDTLCAVDEDNAQFYRDNCEAQVREIQLEFGKLKLELGILKGKTVFVYHPAFGYFLNEFGINQEAVETGGKEPTPRILAELIARAKEEKVRVIFVQAQFPAESGRAVADAIGAELVVLDPLAPDWLANIREMGEALIRAAEKE